MNRIMKDIADLTKGRSFNSYKYSYDAVRTPAPDYDDTPDGYTINWEQQGETESLKEPIPLGDTARQLSYQMAVFGSEPYLKYFLDGSRHVYHVDDISYGSRVFPVIAGQVGVACCRRDDKQMKTEPPTIIKRVISLPDICDKSGRHPEAYLNYIRDKVNENPRLVRLGLHFDKILTYKTDSLTKGKFSDRAIATVQDYMIDSEKGLVDTLAKVGKLKNKAWLVKDGSLEYMPMKTGRFAHYKDFMDSYRWVIGVSKSFNPELCKVSVGGGKTKANADAIIKLPQFYRTPVARISIDRIPGISFAVWYIRLRSLEQTRTPFDGVIKVEKILVTDAEQKKGLDTSAVDDISASIINERNPTCYGADLRYANHLYPVYLTESYVKSTYLSNNLFINLF
jgi:hypothetical protein